MPETAQSLAPEWKLLRACAAFAPSSEISSAAQALTKCVDWDNLLALAQRHGLIPLLYQNLCRNSDNAVPPAPRDRIRQAFIANAAHNLRLTGELLRILGLLDAAGIQCMPFKGPVLAELLFGSISLRQFADLDILVRQEDVRAARDILLADGYEPEFQLGGKRENEYIRSEHAFQFHKSGQGFVIELHWRFGSRNQVFPLDADDVWPRLERRQFQGREILTLSSEDLLLYLAVHGAKHGWDRLEWVACLSVLIRLLDSLQWDRVIQSAERTGALRTLYLGIALAASLAPLDLPPALSERLNADPMVGLLVDVTEKRLLFDEPDHSKREIYRHTFYIRARERWRDRMRILLYFSVRIPHPLAKDWKLFRVPVSFAFLYYLLRPIRLLRQYGFQRLQTIVRPNTGF